jgi:hypothetical protein
MAKLFQILDTSNGNQKLKSLTGADVGINTANFNHNLSNLDTNLQTALDTIDDLVVDKVKASASDNTSGYLIDKLSSTGIIGISGVNNKVNLDVELPVITEAIQDNNYYNCGTNTLRTFPENTNLEIGKKYLMTFNFWISPGGDWNGEFTDNCRITYNESGVEYLINTNGYDDILFNLLQACLGSQPCIQIENLGQGIVLQGTKVITAEDVGGVGKVKLYFTIYNGHLEWHIYSPDNYRNFIEFIQIKE